MFSTYIHFSNINKDFLNYFFNTIEFFNVYIFYNSIVTIIRDGVFLLKMYSIVIIQPPHTFLFV